MQFNTLTLDAFQEQAIVSIQQGQSVLVAAPTGAGKTLIAEYAIDMALREGMSAIYTAPIKALSNQKYRDFCKAYPGKVGIMTGDVTIAPESPLLVMTTEIFRNTIFEDPARVQNVSFVILDEIHYMDDAERGTVWEESILFAPSHIRFICLSATVPNVQEIASWMEQTRHVPVGVVVEDKRPVPLENFFFVDGQFSKKLRGMERGRKKRYFKGRRKITGPLPSIQFICDRKQLPCLYFSFSRAKCQELASAHARLTLLSPEERVSILDLFDELAFQYGVTEEFSARRLRRLIAAGVGYHHAGMMPTLKEIVERLFTSGLLKLIFTTETFALGINMPAQAVIFDELTKFDGVAVGPMPTRDFLQMAGRAGRRGIDDKGFVYTQIETRRLSLPRARKVIFGRPEPVRSQFNACYATLLNLYRDLGDTVPEAYQRSFHCFQSNPKDRRVAKDMISRKLEFLKEMGYIREGALTEKGQLASKVYGYELICTELLASGLLQSLNEKQVAILAMAAIYEPRRKDEGVEIHDPGLLELMARTEMILGGIRKNERQRKIFPLTPRLHFEFTDSVIAWCDGCTFEELMKVSEADEGEVIRHFRRAVQLLRQVRKARGIQDRLEGLLWRASELMNRDLVDAERQLRVG